MGIFSRKKRNSPQNKAPQITATTKKSQLSEDALTETQNIFAEFDIETESPDAANLEVINLLNQKTKSQHRQAIEVTAPASLELETTPPTTEPIASVSVPVEETLNAGDNTSELTQSAETEVTPASSTANPQLDDETKLKLSWATRLKRGLAKSRDKFNKSIASIAGGGQINEELYDDLEAVLLTSDMGFAATEHLLKELREKVSYKGLKDATELKTTLKELLYELIKPLEDPLRIDDDKPFVIMMVGVNGAGKTTTIGKLANHFQSEGKSIILAAGDTFRAAAKEQLIEWGNRNHVAVIAQDSADSAAVCFDTVEAAKARKIDIVLADTAGRLPSQLNLMEEIKKVKRVIQKSLPAAPHEIILVLDANIGQNTLNQVIAFDDALGLTGLIITKLDGTAKGGIIAALAKTRPIPIRYIGVGETIEDLKPFNAREYVNAFFDAE